MSSNHRRIGQLWWAIVLAALAAAGGRAGHASQTGRASAPPAPKALRLYVFDCGVLTVTPQGVERYHVTPAEVGETRFAVPCYLVAHPRGTLLWDVGVIPDSVVETQPQGARANVNPTVAAV